MLLNLNKGISQFYFIIASFLCIHILLRVLFTKALEIDEAEQAFLSQNLTLGYNQQPPLYTWIVIALKSVSGLSIFLFVGLRVVLLFFTYMGIYKLSIKLSGQKKIAMTIALSLSLFPQFSIESFRQTHTVLVTLASVWFVYSLIMIKHKPSLLRFIYLGVIMALGLLSKYNFLIILIAGFITVFSINEFRKSFATPRILISVLIAVLLFLPHGYWFLTRINENINSTILDLRPTSSAPLVSYLLSLWTFVKGIISFSGIFVLVVLLVFRARTFYLFKNYPSPDLRFLRRFITVGLIIFCVIIVGTRATETHERWLQPLLLLLPLLTIQLISDPSKILTFSKPLGVALFSLVLCYQFILYQYGPYLGFFERIHSPYAVMAKVINQELRKNSSTAIFTKEIDLAGNLTMALPNVHIFLMNKEYIYNKEKNSLGATFTEAIYIETGKKSTEVSFSKYYKFKETYQYSAPYLGYLGHKKKLNYWVIHLKL